MSIKVKESITEGHDPEYNTPVYKEMIEIMLKNYKLKEKFNEEVMYQELADYHKNHPDAVSDDIMHLSWNEIMPMGNFIQFTTYIQESAQPNMSYQDCIKLAQRYHFMLLTKLTKEWDDPSFEQKEKTFRQYEEMCDNIAKGYASKEEVAFLKTLPDTKDWDHDVVYDMTYGSPFFPENRKYIDFDDVKQMQQRYIENHPKEKRHIAEQLLHNYKRLKELEDPDNSEENYKIWLGEELRNMQIDKVTDKD